MKLDEGQLKNWKKMNPAERCMYANDLIEAVDDVGDLDLPDYVNQ